MVAYENKFNWTNVSALFWLTFELDWIVNVHLTYHKLKQTELMCPYIILCWDNNGLGTTNTSVCAQDGLRGKLLLKSVKSNNVGKILWS